MTEKTSATVAVTDDSFSEDVLSSSTPVLVDFWAEWCGPCKMVAPVLEEIANDKAGSLKVAKLDVDANPATARARPRCCASSLTWSNAPIRGPDTRLGFSRIREPSATMLPSLSLLRQCLLA